MGINQWNITLFIQQKMWMQWARHDFISGKQDVSNSTWRRQKRALAQHSGVHRFVNCGLLFWVVWDAVTNGPLTIYCLTGLLFMQSGCTYQKFRDPARLALTLHMCRARVQLNHTLAHLLQPSQGASKHGTERSHYSNEQGFRAQTRSVQNTQCRYKFRK